MKVVNALRKSDGFTLVELLTALSIGAVLFGLIFFMFVSMNRYSASAAVKSEVRQTVYLVKSLFGKKVRFAEKIIIGDDFVDLPHQIYVEDGLLIYSNAGEKQVLNNNPDISFNLEFKNNEPMLYFSVTGESSKGEEYSFDMEFLVLGATIYGTSGTRLGFRL